MYLTDIMHGDEIGNWKAALTHLLRVLYALGGDRIQEFNRRWANEIKRGRKLSLTYSLDFDKCQPSVAAPFVASVATFQD